MGPRDLCTELVLRAVAAGADAIDARAELAEPAAVWELEREDRRELVRRYLAGDVSGILQLVQRIAEDLEPER